MAENRIEIARILVTIPALLLAVVPPLADFNATHVTHPLWPSHARFHTVWLVCTNSLVALLALALVWHRGRRSRRRAVLQGAALVGSILLGFFLALLAQSSYGGALTDPNGIPFQVGSLDANLAVFSVCAAFVAAGVGLAWKPVD